MTRPPSAAVVRALLASAIAALPVGCGRTAPFDEAEPDEWDASESFDYGVPRDSGSASKVDAGRADSGSSDAGAADAGSRDAGEPPFDAGFSNVPTIEASLPFGRHEPAVFFDGTSFWALGGNGASGLTDQIVRFDPLTRKVTVTSARLPTARQAAYVAWTGSVAYVFGGQGQSGLLDEIVEFEPSTLQVRVKRAKLPARQYNGAAVWTGQSVYLFGGLKQTPWGPINTILRYDPASDTIATLSATLPGPREQPAAFLINGEVWIVGGFTGTGPTASVARFDLSTETLSTTALLHPTPRAFSGFVEAGAKGYLVGGMNWAAQSEASEVVEFDPAAGTFTQLGLLPVARHGNGVAFGAGAIYAFGGLELPGWKWHAEIQRWPLP